MPRQPTKDTAALYLELPANLRERLGAFVQRTRRMLKGEVVNAIEQYLDREEAKLSHAAAPSTAVPAPPPAEDLQKQAKGPRRKRGPK